MTDEEIAEKMAIWDRLYDEGSKYAHLCKISNGSCARGEPTCCTIQPDSKRRPVCEMLDPVHGCRINTLMCKIWYCAFLKKDHPELIELTKAWDKEARESLPGIIFYQSRGDYETSLRRV